MVFQGRNTTQEKYVRIAAGETSVTYIINSYFVGHQVDIFCQSVHSSEALQASGYPKAINLVLSLQKSGRYLPFLIGFLLCNGSLRMFGTSVSTLFSGWT